MSEQKNSKMGNPGRIQRDEIEQMISTFAGQPGLLGRMALALKELVEDKDELKLQVAMLRQPPTPAFRVSEKEDRR